MHLINLLASENNQNIRAKMKNASYFDLRDNLLITTIRGGLSNEELEDVISNFSFEAIASQSKFKESNSLLYLIKLLLEATDVNLQLKILKTLREDICCFEENRRHLKKIIDNKSFVEYLSNTSMEQISGSMMPCFRSSRASKFEENE